MIVTVMVWLIIGVQFYSLHKMRQCDVKIHFDADAKKFFKWTLINIFSAGMFFGYFFFKFIEWIIGG